MSISLSNMTTSSKISFQYPACAYDSTGPCALQTSSDDACSRQYGGVTNIYARDICKCTNGYYNRSSECWIDCYHYDATTTDFSSISLEQAIVNVNCESYSLAAESQSAFYASISIASVSAASADASSTLTSSFAESAGATAAGSSYVPAIVISGSSMASQGGTAILGAPPSTTDWVNRPSSTVAAQQGVGVSTMRGRRRSALVSAAVVLVLLSILCN